MGDEYITQLIIDELRELCPGPTGCHGCQDWCPKCGTVSNVCNDPECHAHRRDTDILEDIKVTQGEMTRCVRACADLEGRLRRTIGFGGIAVTSSCRTVLRQKASEFAHLERAMARLETELKLVSGPGANLVPRGTRARQP